MLCVSDRMCLEPSASLAGTSEVSFPQSWSQCSQVHHCPGYFSLKLCWSYAEAWVIPVRELHGHLCCHLCVCVVDVCWVLVYVTLCCWTWWQGKPVFCCFCLSEAHSPLMPAAEERERKGELLSTKHMINRFTPGSPCHVSKQNNHSMGGDGENAV